MLQKMHLKTHLNCLDQCLSSVISPILLVGSKDMNTEIFEAAFEIVKAKMPVFKSLLRGLSVYVTRFGSTSQTGPCVQHFECSQFSFDMLASRESEVRIDGTN